MRWFFNSTIQRCDRFWYGGCNEGNGNNFLDEAECLQKCGRGEYNDMIEFQTPIFCTKMHQQVASSVYMYSSSDQEPWSFFLSEQGML